MDTEGVILVLIQLQMCGFWKNWKEVIVKRLHQPVVCSWRGSVSGLVFIHVGCGLNGTGMIRQAAKDINKLHAGTETGRSARMLLD